MILQLNASCRIVKVLDDTRVFRDKTTGNERTTNFLRVNVLDDDGDIGCLRFYEPDAATKAAFVKGKPLPRLDILGLEIENGVSMISARLG